MRKTIDVETLRSALTYAAQHCDDATESAMVAWVAEKIEESANVGPLLAERYR